MKEKFHQCIFLLIIFTTVDISQAKSLPIPSTSNQIPNLNRTLHITHENWKNLPLSPNISVQFLLAGMLSFIAAAISSAGGIGGGGLFIPILTIIAALDLKTASAYSAFMVTGGSIANVGCHMFAKCGTKSLIDYDIALLSEPLMILGVSLGVICNKVFPEWLIMIFFVIFIAFCTFKTCKSGVRFWKLESQGARRNGSKKMENGEGFGESTKEPLLRGELGEGNMGIPWMKMAMLVVIWFSFFLLFLLPGNRYSEGIINVEPCGTVYWIISSIQVPIAIFFTTLILYCKKCSKNNDSTQQETTGGIRTGVQSRDKLTFPIMALLAGVLGGVFGIGGGMLISPLLLQIGINPEVTAATCSFMVLFSSTMSAIQYLLLGMDHIYGAITYASICFIGSLVGLTLVQKAIMKYGRASLIVFSVGIVMALSTVLMTSFGALDVWRDYTSGKNMGFIKKPC